MNDNEKQQAAAIAGKYPGWEAWCGLNGLWHARVLGSVPPFMVHAESPEELSEQIRLSGR